MGATAASPPLPPSATLTPKPTAASTKRNSLTSSHALTLDDDDADALESAVFQEKHGLAQDAGGDQDLPSACIDGLLCCLRSRCLRLSCVLLPCLLLLLVALALSAETHRRARQTLFALAAVPPAVLLLCGVLLVGLVCCRQVLLDTENAQAAHKYVAARSNLRKIAVAAGRAHAEITVAGRLALFFKAASDGALENLQWCLDHGQDVDEADYLGRTALHWASLRGSDEAVAVLLRNGASLDMADALEGLAPLHYAAYYGHVKIVRLLVAAGADLARADRRKMNALQLCEMASLQLASVQPSHQMIVQFLRIAMKDAATPPLQHTTGLTVLSFVERQRMAQPQAAD